MNVSINISGVGYLIIGLVMYLWFGEFTVFSWADPWLYVYAMFWPLVLIYNIAYWMLIVVVLMLVVVGAGYLWDNRG